MKDKAKLAAALSYLFISRLVPNGKSKIKDVITIAKKMGRPTQNPRTIKIGFRMSPKEIDDIQKCADAMNTQRVNAVVEGIQLLKNRLGIQDDEKKK